MLCPACGKESSNIRVCAFCQTPYPTDGSDQSGRSSGKRAMASPRTSKATPFSGVAGDLRSAIARRPRTMRWGAIGLLVAFTAWYFIAGRERAIPVGVVMPNLIAASMTTIEAASTVNAVNRTAQVEVRNGELFVRVATAMFPERRDGQLTFAQQYSRADEIVQGRKRAISFLDPGGSRFARADPGKGVALTR